MKFTSDINVELVQHTGSDATIAAAARVSTGLDMEEYTAEADRGLINYLMKKHHGSPFEHNSMTFRVSAPIFVLRGWPRHPVGWSYNEVSGRYKKLEPKFYTYPADRPLVQSGTGAHPKLTAGTPLLTTKVNAVLAADYSRAWSAYEDLLFRGVANEVARSVLPVATFTEMYATCNARSLMSFLTLRIDHPDNFFDTKPQWEIENAAKQMEQYLKELFPETWHAFVANKRVAP